MSANPEPNPDREPEYPPLHGNVPPPDLRLMREEGSRQLTSWFERLCRQSKWDPVENQIAAQANDAWRDIVSSALMQHGEWWSIIEDGGKIEVLAAAADAMNYYLLMSIAGADPAQGFFLHAPFGAAPLTPGNAAAFMCTMSRSLIDDSLTDFETPGSEASRGKLVIRPLLKTAEFRREVNTFLSGDYTKLIGATVDLRLRAAGHPSEPILAACRAIERPYSASGEGFLIEFPSGHALFDIRHDPQRSSFWAAGPFFVSSQNRPAQDFCYDVRSPHDIRAAVMKDLSRQGFQLLSSPWTIKAAQSFSTGFAGEMKLGDLPPQQPASIYGKKVDEHSIVLMAEIALRDRKNMYLIPDGEFTNALRSRERASLIYAIIPPETDARSGVFQYRLSHLVLPPCGGLEGVVEALVRSPESSQLAGPLKAILGADLKLSEEDSEGMELFSAAPVQLPPAEEIELSLHSAETVRNPILLLVRHPFGAHIVSLQRSTSGLFDVIDDIDPVHYFPISPDAVIRASDPREPD